MAFVCLMVMVTPPPPLPPLTLVSTPLRLLSLHCNIFTLQHTKTRCIALQYTAAHCEDGCSYGGVMCYSILC